MSKPTPAEVTAEIAALEACKTYAPHHTMFGDDNHAKIDLQIEFLKGDIDVDAPEFEEFTSDEQSTIMEAQAWADGESSDGPMSAGWDIFKK